LLSSWIAKSGRRYALSSLDSDSSARAYVSEFVHSARWYFSGRKVLTRSRPPGWHPFTLLNRALYFAPGVHPQFELNPEWKAIISSPLSPPATARDVALSFIGSSTPAARHAILRRVAQRLKDKYRCTTISPVDGVLPQSRCPIIWIEYDETNRAPALPPEQFVGCLHRSTFCLCPPGWGVWTHRVTEAAICGSIPIADERECRLMGLKHRVNAIVARNGDWESAIDAALELREPEVVRIREALAQHCRDILSPDAAAKELARSLSARCRKSEPATVSLSNPAIR
jgi:Exostosin family